MSDLRHLWPELQSCCKLMAALEVNVNCAEICECYAILETDKINPKCFKLNNLKVIVLQTITSLPISPHLFRKDKNKAFYHSVVRTQALLFMNYSSVNMISPKE